MNIDVLFVERLGVLPKHRAIFCSSFEFKRSDLFSVCARLYILEELKITGTHLYLLPEIEYW